MTRYFFELADFLIIEGKLIEEVKIGYEPYRTPF